MQGHIVRLTWQRCTHAHMPHWANAYLMQSRNPSLNSIKCEIFKRFSWNKSKYIKYLNFWESVILFLLLFATICQHGYHWYHWYHISQMTMSSSCILSQDYWEPKGWMTCSFPLMIFSRQSNLWLQWTKGSDQNCLGIRDNKKREENGEVFFVFLEIKFWEKQPVLHRGVH